VFKYLFAAVSYKKNHTLLFLDFFKDYVSHSGHAPTMTISDPSMISK